MKSQFFIFKSQIWPNSEHQYVKCWDCACAHARACVCVVLKWRLQQHFVCKTAKVYGCMCEWKGCISMLWYTFTLILDDCKCQSPRAYLSVVGMLRFTFLTWTNRACPLFFFFCSSVFFCLHGPFNCISFQKNLPTTLRFFTLFFRSYFCLTGPFS